MRTESLEKTKEFAREFVQTLINAPEKAGAEIVCLRGDLGSGKTSFTQGVAEALGIQEDVQSPTFVIEKIYEVSSPRFDRLIHIDAYRLESEDELRRLGWDKIASDPRNLIMIEWPERVPGLIPADSTEVALAFIDENTREIEFTNA